MWRLILVGFFYDQQCYLGYYIKERFVANCVKIRQKFDIYTSDIHSTKCRRALKICLGAYFIVKI